ncbi:hypothetical protein L9F63_015698 [Diploptera punctata]|uniref:Proteasome assembly chaperone 4 n=1 Tax=Diploptera punctata TaxID=6984 RepID=A0AAD8A754_DIPPU|nr:hypothetical protein L9F63_015698 [Diploptera punctata]
MEENISIPNSNETLPIEYIKPSFEIHGFSTEITETPVYFHVMKMESSVFIWIGSGSDPTFEDLSMAMNTRYDSLPLGTRLMGPGTDMTSSNLAIRLSKKLGQAVYVSYNLASDGLTLPAVEKRLHEEMKTHPEKFGI